jgi:hypothetical protein
VSNEEASTPVVEVVRSDAAASAPLPPQDLINAILDVAPTNQGIHTALHAVKTTLPAIEKEGELTFGSNTVKFTRVEDVRKALYPAFAKYGIMAYLSLYASEEKLQVAEEPWTQAQAISPETGLPDRTGIIGNTGRPILDGRIPKTRMWAWVEYTLRLVFIGDGSEVLVGPVKGSAYDTDSDKATGKATTAAIKRILVETFDIVDEKEGELDETGEDTKNRPETTDRRTAQEGEGRGGQAMAAAAPGASARPGRPTRSGPRSKAPAATEPQVDAPAPEPKPEPAPEPTAAPEPVVETAAEEKPEPAVEPQQPSDAAVEAADPATGEVPDEAPAEPEVTADAPPAAPSAPMPDRLVAAKERVKKANAVLGLSKAEVDAIATQATGIANREEWITKGTAVAKLADALEERIAKANQA